MIGFLLLIVTKSSNAAVPIPVQTGHYTDGRQNIFVTEYDHPETTVRWFNIGVSFGKFGFFFNPRSGEAVEFPYLDPRDPTPHRFDPYVLQERLNFNGQHYFRWRQGGLLKAEDTTVELGFDFSGHLTSLKVRARHAVLRPRPNALAKSKRPHSGPWKRQYCAYNCENLRAGYDDSLEPQWFKDYVSKPPTCPGLLESSENLPTESSPPSEPK